MSGGEDIIIRDEELAEIESYAGRFVTNWTEAERIHTMLPALLAELRHLRKVLASNGVTQICEQHLDDYEMTGGRGDAIETYNDVEEALDLSERLRKERGE